MHRRKYLALSIATLAGCAGGDTDDDTTDEPQPDTPDETATDPATDTPTDAPTDTPEDTPEETDTPTETPEPVPDIPAQEFDGSGDSVIDEISAEGGLAVFELTHDGDRNFQGELLTQGGDTVEYLVNAIGEYDGRVVVPLAEGEYMLDLTADGSWELVVEQPRWAEDDVDQAPVSASGQHADYLGPIYFEGGETISVEAEGDGNLAVWLRDVNGEQVDLLANDIAPFESEAVITDSGYGLLSMETDRAEWSVEVE